MDEQFDLMMSFHGQCLNDNWKIQPIQFGQQDQPNNYLKPYHSKIINLLSMHIITSELSSLSVVRSSNNSEDVSKIELSVCIMREANPMSSSSIRISEQHP